MNRALITPFLMAALYFAISAMFHFLGGAIDQPHPVYENGNWVTQRMPQLIQWSAMLAIVMFILVCIDLAIQHCSSQAMTKDLAFFPRFWKVHEFLKPLGGRLLLISCAGLLALYWGQSLIAVWTWREINSGWVWPPERFFVTCLLAWGLLWIIDCFSRPRHTTIFAAVGLTLFTLLFLLPIIGVGILRE